MSEQQRIENLVGHFFRHEAGKMAAVLTRILGPQLLDEVDDIVQHTLLKALETWKIKGTPANPSAWLYQVARNKAIDVLRERKKLAGNVKADQVEDTLPEAMNEIDIEKEIEDSVLRMMFACCHPSIPVESQLAFTLKTLAGLSVKEIASAFFVSEDTIAKRIYRAKEKIRNEKIEIEPPPVYELVTRLESVCKVLYLLFNEGYYSNHAERIIREDLCAEAMRLTYLLIRHPQTGLPHVKALFALMCLQASRFPARADDQNQIVLLEHQDRSKWNLELMKRGFHWLEQASVGDWLTEYHVEAAIASVHASATEFSATNWHELLKLYETLQAMKPSITADFNRAIARGYAISPQSGVDALLQLTGLETNRYYHVALGDFYVKLNQTEQAKACYQTALHFTPQEAEQKLIESKLGQIS